MKDVIFWSRLMPNSPASADFRSPAAARSRSRPFWNTAETVTSGKPGCYASLAMNMRRQPFWNTAETVTSGKPGCYASLAMNMRRQPFWNTAETVIFWSAATAS
jgi:hypothetical protein